MRRLLIIVVALGLILGGLAWGDVERPSCSLRALDGWDRVAPVVLAVGLGIPVSGP
jgi:hypothetical protein